MLNITVIFLNEMFLPKIISTHGISNRTDVDILHVDGSSVKQHLIKNGDLRDFRKFHVHPKNTNYLVYFLFHEQASMLA